MAALAAAARDARGLRAERYAPDNSGAAPFDQVTVTLNSGVRLPGPEVRRATGHADLPLSESDLFQKFQGCLEAGGVGGHAVALFDRLITLDKTPARELACLPCEKPWRSRPVFTTSSPSRRPPSA